MFKTNPEFIQFIKNLNLKVQDDIDINQLDWIGDQLAAYKYELMHKFNHDYLDINELNFYINKTKVWMDFIDYIHCHLDYFQILKLNNVMNDVKKNGIKTMEFKKQFTKNPFKNKDLIFQITDKQISTRKKSIKLDFNLMDKYHWYSSKKSSTNYVDVIESLDDLPYLSKQIKFNNQIHTHDKLYAIISLENQDQYCVCEYFSSWLLNTHWAYFFNIVNKEIKQFYIGKKLDYHFPYHLSWSNSEFGINMKNMKISLLYKKLLSNFNIFNHLRFNKSTATNKIHQVIKSYKYNFWMDKICDLLINLLIELQIKCGLLIKKIALNNLVKTQNEEEKSNNK